MLLEAGMEAGMEDDGVAAACAEAAREVFSLERLVLDSSLTFRNFLAFPTLTLLK